MNVVRYLVDVEMDNLRIFKPPDLLDRSDRFAAMPSLDGTSHGILLPESRAETAVAYFDTLDAALKEKWREEVKESVSLPEFRVLAWHVLVINGPLLPDNMTKHTMPLWQDNGV